MLFFQQNHYFLRIQNHLLQRPVIDRKQRFSLQLMTNGLIKRTDSEPVQPMGTIMFSPSSSGKILNTKGKKSTACMNISSTQAVYTARLII